MQPDDGENTENTWLTQAAAEVPVTSLQPLRLSSTEAADSFYDFDIEPESPGSPIDECEYTRLIETTTTTPSDATVPPGIESGYVCASPCSSTQGSEASHSASVESAYYDPEASESDRDETKLSNGSATEFYDCVDSRQEMPSPKLPTVDTVDSGPAVTRLPNGHAHTVTDSDSCSESLPPSQSTDSNLTYTVLSSASNSTLQDEILAELVAESKETDATERENNESNEVKVEKNHTDSCREPSVETSTLQVDAELTLDCTIQVVTSDESTQIEKEDTPEKDSNLLGSTTETDDDDDDKPRRLQRSSSLKTGKTPPGTPGRKKFVRFADVLGLDLADVKTFLDHEIPKIPKSAYDDLDYRDPQPDNFVAQFGPQPEKMLVPLFQQPGGLPSFLDKVRERQVCLENAAVTDPVNMTISGTVRVRNLDFNKSVHLRYTLDNWKSFSDLQANYVTGSCDGFSDTFSFMFFGNSLQVGQRIEMAIRFQCKGQQFWDNNHGTNYCFQCLPTNKPKEPVTPPHIQPHHLHNECSGAFY